MRVGWKSTSPFVLLFIFVCFVSVYLINFVRHAAKDIVFVIVNTLFLLSKDKVYKDIEAEILPKIKDILRTKPSLRFVEKEFLFRI